MFLEVGSLHVIFILLLNRKFGRHKNKETELYVFLTFLQLYDFFVFSFPFTRMLRKNEHLFHFLPQLMHYEITREEKLERKNKRKIEM